MRRTLLDGPTRAVRRKLRWTIGWCLVLVVLLTGFVLAADAATRRTERLDREAQALPRREVVTVTRVDEGLGRDPADRVYFELDGEQRAFKVAEKVRVGDRIDVATDGVRLVPLTGRDDPIGGMDVLAIVLAAAFVVLLFVGRPRTSLRARLAGRTARRRATSAQPVEIVAAVVGPGRRTPKGADPVPCVLTLRTLDGRKLLWSGRWPLGRKQPRGFAEALGPWAPAVEGSFYLVGDDAPGSWAWLTEERQSVTGARKRHAARPPREPLRAVE